MGKVSMPDDFLLQETFTAGFHQKLAEDETPPGAAVSGSKNFALDDDGKWVTRPGSEFLGTLDTLTGGVTAAGKLRRRDGTEIPVMSFGTRTKYYHPDLSPRAWVILDTGLTSGAVMGFATWDRSSNNVNSLVMSNGTDAYRIWSGVTGVVSSFTATTIVLTGSTTLANRGFSATGNISVNGIAFAYTGLSSSTFTGVTPDPTGTAIAAGQGMAQTPVTYGSNPLGNVLLASDRARVLVGNIRPSAAFNGGGAVQGSKIDDATDFAASTPRVAGDGFTLNVTEGGGTITGMAQFENLHYVFKNACIKRLSFSQDNNDVVQLQSLSSYDERTSSDDGSVSALAVFRGGDSILFVSPTKVVNSIGRVQYYDYPQRLPISDPIKAYVDALTFDTETAGISWRGRAFIACKSNSTVGDNDRILVYNLRYGVWETPIEGLSISAFFVFGGNLYGCLSSQPDAIRLWTGTRDLVRPTATDFPINAELRLWRNNFGTKNKRKEFDRIYIEGEMLQTGSVTFDVQFNENSSPRSVTMLGTESGFFFASSPSGSFGTVEFGAETFGPSGAGVTSSTSPVRFRLILSTTKLPFYNVQLRVRTSSYFKLIAIGPNSRISPFVQPTSIYKAIA